MNEEAFAVIRASSGKTAARRLLIGAGAMALLIPAVAGCEAGENAPTIEFHSASSGAHTVFNGITITNAFVLAGPSGSSPLPTGSNAGLFVGLFNTNTSADALTGASAPGTAGSVSLTSGTVALPPEGSAYLTGPAPDVVLNDLTKPLSGGTTIPVTFSFARAGSVTLQVPVEPMSYYWATYSPAPSPATTGTASPTTTSTATSTASPTASPTATP
jgi:copper(I)-binding protein